MKYLALLVFAALTLVPQARADTVDFESNGGGKDVIVMGAVAPGMTWSVTDDLVRIVNLTKVKTIKGPELGTVDITTGTLFKCAIGLCFHGGSLVVKSEAGKMLLDRMYKSGVIRTTSTGLVLTAGFRGGGTTEMKLKNGFFNSDSSAHGVTAVVPEPASLMLVGTGLLGLTWRKWRTK